MYDLADTFFESGLEESVEYISAGSRTPTTIDAIVRQGYNNGRESGKGLNPAVRSRQGIHATIIVKQADVPKIKVRDKISTAGGITFEVVEIAPRRSGILELRASSRISYGGPLAGQTER